MPFSFSVIYVRSPFIFSVVYIHLGIYVIVPNEFYFFCLRMTIIIIMYTTQCFILYKEICFVGCYPEVSTSRFTNCNYFSKSRYVYLFVILCFKTLQSKYLKLFVFCICFVPVLFLYSTVLSLYARIPLFKITS